MLEVLDIQEQLDYLVDDDGHEYEFIIVTAIYDPEEPYSEMWFGKKSDQELAIESGIDCRLYAYLPDCYFEDVLFGRLSSHDIRELWDYIEKNYD